MQSGMLSQSFSTAAVKGVDGVGGLVGGVDSGYVHHAYAAGSVTSSDSLRVGGLLGYAGVQARLDSSYWDVSTTGSRVAVALAVEEAVLAAKGLATEAMRTRSSFAGWDFDGIWKIEEGVSYPVLRFLESSAEPVGVHAAPAALGLAAGSYSLAVFDLRGREVWSGKARWNGVRWELPALGAGAWIVRARTPRGPETWRVAALR